MKVLIIFRQLGANQAAGAKSMERLSSGLRINRAGDDAAGLSISEKMRGQIRGLKQASRNAQDGISMIQTAEGGLNETHAILQRMRELAVQASNGTNNQDDLKAIGQELKDLTSEIDRISKTTEFNGKKLLNGDLSAKLDIAGSDAVVGSAYDGSMISRVDVSGALANETYTLTATDKSVTLTRSSDNVSQTVDIETFTDGRGGLDFSSLGVSIEFSGDPTTSLDALGAALNDETIKTQAGDSAAQFAIGSNGHADEKMNIAFVKMDSSTLGDATNGFIKGLVNDVVNVEDVVATAADADKLTKALDSAIKVVSEQRSKLGAAQNRLEHTISNLGTSAENLQAAESRIRDLDMAEEMMSFTKSNILNQAATAMLAQANMAPQSVLQLLG